MSCIPFAGCTSVTRAVLLSSNPAKYSCAGHVCAGPGLHCGPGSTAAPHAWRPDPTASAQSASTAHQSPHHAGGVHGVIDYCLPIAWATVVSMQIM